MIDPVDRALASVPVAPFASGPVPAADDVPFPIGSGQRGTPPDTVRRLLHEAHVSAGQRVLELGSGTGFTAAIAAALGAEVHGVERLPELVARAHATLRAIGSTAQVHHGDALEGWPDAAPYDVIVGTIAVRRLPPPWLRQLAPDGVLVVPIGPAEARQELTVFRRVDGALERVGRGPARFAGAEVGLSPGP